VKYNRPRKYDPVISAKYLEQVKRGVRILQERVRKGHKNPQAWLHGEVKTYSPEEIAAFVELHPNHGPLHSRIAEQVRDRACGDEHDAEELPF
jgi:hypothetical protein